MSPSVHVHNGNAYPSYKSPSNEAIKREISEFRAIFKCFCDDLKFDQSEFSLDEALVIRCIIRVDQRKLHYKMYHKGIRINELKEIALLCYWINHYKPIVHVSTGTSTVDTYNAIFSIYLMLATITECREMGGQPAIKIAKKTFVDLRYTMIHRLTSYDSMVLLVEALAAMP